MDMDDPAPPQYSTSTSPPSRSRHEELCDYPMTAQAMIDRWMMELSLDTQDSNDTDTAGPWKTALHARPVEDDAFGGDIHSNTGFPLHEAPALDNTHSKTRRLHAHSLASDTELPASNLENACLKDDGTPCPPSLDTATTNSPPLSTIATLDNELDRNDHITKSMVSTASDDESLTPADDSKPTDLLIVEPLKLHNPPKQDSKPKIWEAFKSLFNYNSCPRDLPTIASIIPLKHEDRGCSVNSLSYGDPPKTKPILPPLSKEDKKKKTLVLDLDETLVHTAFRPMFEYEFFLRVQVVDSNFSRGELADVYVITRPGLDNFLEEMSIKYELVIFTASTKSYADAIIDRIDPQGLVKHRLYRESCVLVDGALVKDLATLGRDLKKVIIVDNTPHCYGLQPDNAVPVSSFIDDKEDDELLELIPFLSLIAEFDDVTISLNTIPRELSKSHEAFTASHKLNR